MENILELVMTVLGERAGWTRKQDLLTALAVRVGLDEVPDERIVRDAISNSGGRILSTTSGYKLTSAASREEMQHAVNDLKARAASLESRADDCWRQWIATHQTTPLTVEPTPLEPSLFEDALTA